MLFSFALAGWGQGNSLTTGQWVDLGATGYGFQVAGYDSASYTGPTHNTLVAYGNCYTLGVTSEGQDCMGSYDYPANRFTWVMEGGGFHGPHRPGMGHQMGIQTYIPPLDSVIFQTNYSYANQVDRHTFMFAWDVAGMTGMEMPIMTSSTPTGSQNTLTRVWANFAGGMLSEAAWDSQNSSYVVYPDYRLTATGAQICTFGTNLNLSCVSSGGGSGPASGFYNFGMAGNGTGLIYMTTGAASYTLNTSTGTWATLTTSCAGADCSGSAPLLRYGMGWAWSPDDNVFGMLSGSSTSGSGSVYQDFWTFNPSTNAWTEICGPGLNPSKCSAFQFSVYKPGNRLVYDTLDHAFLWVQAGVSNSVSVAAFALGTVAPLNYGRTTFSGSPTAGSLNINAPSGTNQGYASDVYLSGSVLTHVETTPTGGAVANCNLPTPYTGTISFTGGVPNVAYSPAPQSTACNVEGFNVNTQPAGNSLGTVVNGPTWMAYAQQKIAPPQGEVNTTTMVQAYNSPAQIWDVPAFPPYSCTSISSCTQSTSGSTGTTLSGSVTLTLSPLPANVSTASVLLIQGGAGAAERVQVSSVNSGTSQITFSVGNTHTGAWTVQDSGWIGCFTVVCTFSGGTNQVDYWHNRPEAFIAVGTTPTVATIEQNDRDLGDRELPLRFAAVLQRLL